MKLSLNNLIICAIAIKLISVCAATNDNKRDCSKPKCYLFSMENMQDRVSVKKQTTFCFTGLKKSMYYLWANPVLKITRNYSNGSFVTYFGTSSADVEVQSKRRTLIFGMVQQFSSSRYFKETEDFSFSPFNNSCYMIDSEAPFTAKFQLKVADIWYIIYLLIGIIIFFSAKSWSHNTTLHYGSGISIGVLAFVLIFFFILSRFLPSKLKSIGYLLMFFGSSVSLWVLQTFSSYLHEPLTETVIENWQYFAGYLAVSGLISFAVVYRYGPITDERTLNLVQWFLQFIGLVIVYNSTHIQEVSIALVLVLLGVYNFPTRFFGNSKGPSLWQRFFPPKIKLLTEDEYNIQGEVETKKELEKLRQYCQSPDCKAWKVISKLKSPHRFAEFVEGNSWHITNDEMLEYDSGPDPLPPHLVTDDDDSDSEMDFVLSSP